MLSHSSLRSDYGMCEQVVVAITYGSNGPMMDGPIRLQDG